MHHHLPHRLLGYPLFRRGEQPWAATATTVVLLLTCCWVVGLLLLYARWLLQTSHYATLLSLLSTIVMWGGVRNDPSCLSNGVGCELDEQQQDTNGEGTRSVALSECTLDIDTEDSFYDVLVELKEKFATDADGENTKC